MTVELLDRHWHKQSPSFRQRVTRDQLRELLLADRNIIRAGNLCQMKHRSLSVGVYEIWFDVVAKAEAASGE